MNVCNIHISENSVTRPLSNMSTNVFINISLPYISSRPRDVRSITSHNDFRFSSYPTYYKGDDCFRQFGLRGSISYIIQGRVHYPHITVGDDDLQHGGFHVTISKRRHVFFKSTNSFPFCSPVLYDRVTMDDLWEIFNYAKEFAAELRAYRSGNDVSI